jgi:hypothetical protein
MYRGTLSGEFRSSLDYGDFTWARTPRDDR